MLETAFSSVLRMSTGAAVIIPAVVLLRLVLKRTPKIWSYLLWILVLVRLLCPVLPETVFSPVVATEGLVYQVENVIRHTPVFEGPADAPLESQYADPEKLVEAEPSVPYEDGKEPMSLQYLLGLIWLTGMVAVLVWGSLSMRKLKSKLFAAVPLEKNVYAADHIQTSFVTGLVRPKIYLPSDLSKEWTEVILRHECCHIRRLDPLVKFLYFLALAVHWFNPLVWLAYRLMTRDMEMSCDEAVAGQMTEEERRGYAQCLLCLTTGRRSFPVPLGFGEGDTEQRIRNVLHYKKPAVTAVILMATLCLVAAVFILTDPVWMRSPRLEYPGFSWGASPEEVMSALKDIGNNRMILNEIRWEADAENSYGGYAVLVGDVEMFGQRATSAVFRFIEYTWDPGRLMLEEIILYYPDGYAGETADLEALKRKITDMCGEPVEEIVSPSWYPGRTEIQEERKLVNPGFTVWESEETVLDILTEEDIQALYARMTQLYTENGTQDQLPSLEAYRATLDTAVAGIVLRETYFSLMGMDRELTEQMREQGATDYVLTLSGQTYLGYLDAVQIVKEP